MNFVEHFFFAAAHMLWEMFWALALGFLASAAIMVFVPRAPLEKWLGRFELKSLTAATIFGALSSSCSYAATSMAKSLFQRGAHIVPALVFMLASTNLVFELSAVLWTLLGWQFVVAEIFGGLVMIGIFALFMRFLAPLKDFETLREQGAKAKAPADRNFKEMARVFCSEVRMIRKEIVVGILLSAAAMVFIPDEFWQILFLKGDTSPWLRTLENALVGPLVAMLSSVCSIGNIPLARVLYTHGVSFAGVISFIYADLIILPLLVIYRRFYGTRLALWIAAGFYCSFVVSGLLTEAVFAVLNLIPPRPQDVGMAMDSFNKGYLFWLNLIFLILGLALFRLGKKAKPSCCH